MFESYNLKFIIAAYAATWIVILGYHWRLARKSAEVRADHARAVSSERV